MRPASAAVESTKSKTPASRSFNCHSEYNCRGGPPWPPVPSNVLFRENGWPRRATPTVVFRIANSIVFELRAGEQLLSKRTLLPHEFPQYLGFSPRHNACEAVSQICQLNVYLV